MAAERKGVDMSTYTQELAKRIREQNEIRDIYKERAQEVQTSYDTAVNTLKSGGDVYSLDDSARAMYRNIQSELAKQQREEQERLKKEREQMSGIERFGHTLGDFFGQGVGGLMKFGENTVDYFGTMFGADEDWIKRDWTQELFMDKLREGTKGSFLNDGKFGNMVQSSMFGLGNMLPSLALNAVPYVGGALSTASFMVNAAGGSTENALQNGASRDKALLYGTLSGISEGAIEKISGGIGGVGKGIVQSVGKSAGKSAVAKGVLGTAKKYTGRMIGEGLEEVASDVIDPLLRATYTGKVDYSDMTAGSLAETFGVGAMTSGLVLGGQAMAHNATATNRVRTKLGELNEVKAALEKRYYDGKLTEAQYKQGLSDINWLAEKIIKKMNRVSDKKAEKIVYKVGEKRLENAGIIQSNGGFRVNSANAGAYNYKAMTPSLANKVDTLAYKPTSAELTAEQESLVKDYGKINNGKASIVFTDDIGAVTEDGSKVSANGAYSDGVIYISRTAENPLREVMKHEFTHALEGTKAYGKFASFVIDEIQKSPVLQKEYGDFAKTFIETAEQYKGVTADDGAVVSEIVAKYSERLFSDPKAINRLARANKGLAMKVLGLVTDRLSALGKGKGTAEMRKFLRRAESLYRKAISAKPSRGIALNGNTANEKDTTADTTADTTVNSNIENTANTVDTTENRTNIETNSQNINENSNITDGKESTSKQFDLKESIKNLNSYSELERNRILANKNNLIAEDYQSIIDFITESKNDLKNKFLYIGKINSDIVLKIKDETGINVNDYSYVLNSEDIRHIFKNHSDNIKESERGQLAVTNSNVLDIIDTMLMPDGIRKEYNEKSGVVSIVFEKVINERLMAITVLSNDKKRLTLKSARIIKKRRIVSPSVQFTSSDKTSTSKTLRSLNSSNNSISNSETNVNNSATESLKYQENTANNDENSNNDVKYSLKANMEQKKAYTHKDADAMVRGIIKLISDNETVKIRNVKEISDEFYRNINSGMDEGVAAVIVSERIVDEAYTEHYDPTSVERAGDVIEFYNKHIAKKFNLDSINAELKDIFGGNVATVKRVAHNADGLDVAKIREMTTAIHELGIDIDSKATPAEIFTAIYNEYRDAKEIEKGYKQSIKDSKTAKERNALVQKLAKAMLFAFDKYGSETKLYKRVKELSDTVESLKNYNRTERAKEKSRANIVDEVRLFKELSRRGISAHIIKDSVADTLIKAISRIVSRKDINSSNLVAATEVLRNFYTEERIGGDYSITHRQYIDELSNELANVDKRTKDLTAYQLDLADKMIKNIRQYIRTAENITRDGKNESGRELGQKADDAMRQDEELRNKYKVKNVVIKFFRTLRGIVDPKSVIGMAEGGRKDGVIGMLYDDIKKAETNQLAMQIEFMEPMDNFFKENKGYAKRLSQSYTIGKTEITFDDAIAILLVSKRAHASATIDGVDYGGVYYQGGGFSYELDNGKTVYIDVSRSDIERIEKSLSELDLEYIDILEEFYNKKARKAKKETDRIIIGSTTVVDGEYYYPISRADEMIAKKFGDSRDLINNVQNYENLSFNKHVVANARNPIKLRGSLEVFTEYAKLMSAYATMTQALKNFSKVMSINLNAGIPGARIKTLRSTLKETAPFMEKYMDDLLQDIQGTGRQKTSKLLSKMRDGYIKAVLGANVKTWFSQWAGVPSAMTYLSPRDMAKGFAMHVTKEEFIKHSKFGKAHIYNQSAVRSEGIEQKIGSVGDFFMRPIGFSDKWMHIGYWQSCRYAVQRMYGHELGTEANYRMADELYEKVARETQSTNVMSERSAMQRSESEIMRTLTTFASDAQKQLSRIVEGSVSYIYAQMRYNEGLISKQELRASRNQLVRSVSSFALSNAVYVAIGLLFNALLLKREEEGKKWGAEDYAKAFGMGMLESYAGLFPIFRDMYNKVASGYDIEHFSYSMINDLVDSTVGVYKLVENRIKGEEVTRMDALKTLRQSLYSVNAFLGMPTKNVAKYAKMIVGWFNEGALYKYNSLFYPAKKSALNAAIEEKNDRLSESIVGVMLTERGYGDLSVTAQKKLLELYKAVYKDGISVIPSNVPNKVTWKDGNGAEQEKDLKATDKAVYRANNAKAAKDIEKLLKSGEFSSLSRKEQADAVKKVYAYYNALSKSKVTEKEEINTQMLLASLLSVEDMAILSVKNASLVADKYVNGKTIPDSKKKKLLKLLNTFGLTFAEKELVRVILGYSPSNPKTIKQTIRHSSLSSEEKAYLIGKLNRQKGNANFV